MSANNMVPRKMMEPPLQAHVGLASSARSAQIDQATPARIESTADRNMPMNRTLKKQDSSTSEAAVNACISRMDLKEVMPDMIARLDGSLEHFTEFIKELKQRVKNAGGKELYCRAFSPVIIAVLHKMLKNSRLFAARVLAGRRIIVRDLIKVHSGSSDADLSLIGALDSRTSVFDGINAAMALVRKRGRGTSNGFAISLALRIESMPLEGFFEAHILKVQKEQQTKLEDQNKKLESQQQQINELREEFTCSGKSNLKDLGRISLGSAASASTMDVEFDVQVEEDDSNMESVQCPYCGDGVRTQDMDYHVMHQCRIQTE